MTEAHTIRDTAKRIAEQPWLTRHERDLMAGAIAKAINDAVMAERERCAEICVARSKEHAASRHVWVDADSVNLCLSDSIEALNCASAIRTASKAER